MGDITEVTASTAGQRTYERVVGRRLRVATLAARLRAGGIQAVWLVVLVAGAAVPLAEAAITDGWTWLTPTLGFVIVIAAGLERIFRRTTDAAVPLDELRRNLARERRLLTAGADVYGEPNADFSRYVERVERHIDTYDQQMLAYHRDVFGRA